MIKQHFAWHCKLQHSWTPAPFICMACHISSFLRCDGEANRNVNCCASFSYKRWKDGRGKWAGWSRDMGRGRIEVGPAHTALACIITHSLSATLPFSVTLCLFFRPPTFSFHPRPTFLVVVGVAIRHGAQCEKHKAKLGQILHAAQITPEDCTLSQVHCAARSFFNSSLFLYLCRGLLCPNISSVSMFPLLYHAHTHINRHMHLSIIIVPTKQVVCIYHWEKMLPCFPCLCERFMQNVMQNILVS